MKLRRKAHLEDQLQASCVQFFRLKYPNRLIFAIPNGGFRHPLEALKLKRCGVTPGIPDLFIAHASGGFHGLFIEMKTEMGRLTKQQKEIKTKLESENFLVVLCRSLGEFERTVGEYVRKSLNQ